MEGKYMKTVNDILEQKGREVHTIESKQMVRDAIQQLAELGIGALVVVKDGKPVGLMSERDYTCRVILAGKHSDNTPVEDIMSNNLIVVAPGTNLNDCMVLMTENRLRHLPVMNDNKLVGLVSIGDIVKDIISEQQFVIEQLEQYIYHS